MQYKCTVYMRLLFQTARAKMVRFSVGNKAGLICVYFGKRYVVLLGYYTSNY